MIHKARKAESKNGAVIFGVATDGFEYRFWRVDRQSNVSGIMYCSTSMLRIHIGIVKFRVHMAQEKPKRTYILDLSRHNSCSYFIEPNHITIEKNRRGRKFPDPRSQEIRF